MITFACFSPHPPLLLPGVGKEEDKKKVKKTIESLNKLARAFNKAQPETIIISSPHPEWGFNVPLYFIANNFNGEIINYLTGGKPPQFYFEEGKRIYRALKNDKKYAFIASGDLSHRLKKEGPYGFHPHGPQFDKFLINFLKKKDIKNFLKLDEQYPEAAECGLRSFSFLIGALEEFRLRNPKKNRWKPNVLSYEGPFGVGYLVVNFRL